MCIFIDIIIFFLKCLRFCGRWTHDLYERLDAAWRRKKFHFYFFTHNIMCTAHIAHAHDKQWSKYVFIAHLLSFFGRPNPFFCLCYLTKPEQYIFLWVSWWCAILCSLVWKDNLWGTLPRKKNSLFSQYSSPLENQVSGP